MTADWEERIAAAWASIDDHDPSEFRAIILDLAAERPPGDAMADFERGCAFDSTGDPAQAVEHYRAALAGGVTGVRRRRAVIQLSSSLRNLGHADQAVSLLRAELDNDSDEYDDAVKCTLALALTDLDREREAVSLLVTALVPRLPRYQRSMTNYARMLTET